MLTQFRQNGGVTRKPGHVQRVKSFVIAASAIATLISCSDATAPTVSQSDLPSHLAVAGSHGKGFAWVGKAHNDGLRFVLKELQKNKGKFHSGSEMCQAAIEATRKYDNEVLHSHGQMVAAALKAGLADCAQGNDARPSLSSQSGIRLSLVAPALRYSVLDYYPELAGMLSAEAIQLLDQMLDEINAGGNNLSPVLASVEATANSDLSGDDAVVVLAATAVGDSSLAYWSTSTEGWIDVYDPLSQPPLIETRLAPTTGVQRTFSLPGLSRNLWVSGGACGGWLNSNACDYLRTISGADLGGAILGGVSGLIATGPGGAAVGAVSVGLGTSVVAGTYWLWKHYTQ